jgi:hypothetical protein
LFISKPFSANRLYEAIAGDSCSASIKKFLNRHSTSIIAIRGMLGLKTAPFNIYSLPGLIFVEGLNLTLLAFLIIAAALEAWTRPWRISQDARVQRDRCGKVYHLPSDETGDLNGFLYG